MFTHERFQAFCRWCHKVLEADTAHDAIQAAIAHEGCCEKSPNQQEKRPGA